MSEQRRSIFDVDLSGLPEQSAPAAPAEPVERAVVSDIAKGVGIGALNMAQGVAGLSSFAGADLTPDSETIPGTIYNTLGNLSARMTKSQSPAMQQARGNVMQAWQEGESFGSNVGSTLAATAQNPYFLAGLGAEAVGSILPVAKGASMLGRVAPKMSTAARAGVAEGTVVGGLVGGEIAADPNTDYTDRLIGIPAGLAGAGIGFAGGKLAGRLDPDVFFADMFSNRATRKAVEKGSKGAAVNLAAGKGAVPASVGRLGNAAVGLTVQAGEEGLQEGMETAAVNIGIGNEIMEGVGQAFTIGAMAGGLVGGGLGLSTGADKSSRNLNDPADTPPATDTATDTAPAPQNDTQAAFRTVAAFIAARNFEQTDTTNADPVGAQAQVDNAFRALGEVEPTRAGLQRFLKQMGAVKPAERTRFYAQLAAMTQSQDAKVSKASRRLLRIATGLGRKSLPNMNSRKSLRATETLANRVQLEAATLESRIKKVGDGDKAQRAVWQAKLSDLKVQLKALQATHYVISQGITAQAQARDMQQAQIIEEGRIMRPQDSQQRELTLERGDQQGEPMLTEPGGEAVVDPAMAAEPVTDPGLAPDQTNMFGDVPTEGALELSAYQLRRKPKDDQDRIQRDGQRLAFVAAVQQKLVEAINQGNVAANELLNLRNEGVTAANLAKLAKLTGVPKSKLEAVTRGELARADGAVSGSALDVMQRAVDDAVQRGTQAYEQQFRGLVEAARANPALPLGQLLKQVAGPVRRVKDLPVNMRQRIEQVRSDTSTERAFTGNPTTEVQPGLALPESPVVNPADVAAERVLEPQQAELGLEQERPPPGPKTQGSGGPRSSADPAPRARLSNEPTVPQMDGGLLQRVISRIVKGWRNVPEIVVIENMTSELVPQAVRDALTMPDGAVRFMLATNEKVARLRFRNWFKRSRVVTPNGKPRVLFHGSNSDILEFRNGSIYATSESRVAETYTSKGRMENFDAADGARPAVYPLYMSIQRPLVLFGRNRNWSELPLGSFVEYNGQVMVLEDLIYLIQEQYNLDMSGYLNLDTVSTDDVVRLGKTIAEITVGSVDGVIFEQINDTGMTSYAQERNAVPDEYVADMKAVSDVFVAFDPNQVKSAIGNDGSYSPLTNDIRFQIDQAQQKPAAFFYNGKVYINKEMMGSEQDVALALYHEIVGHFGLRGVLGNRLNPELDRIWRERQTDVMLYAQKYKLDTTKVEQRREAVEEFLAAQAETLYEQGLLTNIINMIKAWWADLTGQTLTDEQIMRDYIRPAQSFVARRNVKGLSISNGEVRFKAADADMKTPPGAGLIAQSNEISQLERTANWGTRMLAMVADKTSFTKTMLRRMATRVPATQKLLNTIQRAESIANTWNQEHNIVGELMHGLSNAQQKSIIAAMLHYSSSEGGRVPLPLEHAQKMWIADETVDPADWAVVVDKFSDSELNIDDSVYKNLDEQSQRVVRLTFEAMAKVLNARTQMRLNTYKHFYERLLREGNEPEKLREDYTKAVNNILAEHNRSARGAYVPQSRVGQYLAYAKSAEYVATEQAARDGDVKARKKLKKMRKDPKHYIYYRDHSELNAKAVRDNYVADANFAGGDVDFGLDIAGMKEDTIGVKDLARLLTRYENESRETAGSMDPSTPIAKLSESLRREMRAALAEMGSQDSEVSAALRRENVAGVNDNQLLQNTLDHIKHFGYALASASVSAERSGALMDMSTEIKRLRGSEQVREAKRFNEIIERINDEFDIKEGLLDRAARQGMGAASVYYLLTNPSYYLLQLTQSWIMTAPYLAGEFGPKAWSELAKSFDTMRPLVKTLITRGQELRFEGYPPGVQQMFTTLQARSVLDVGMNHDLGELGRSGMISKGMAKMYFAARSVELLNRTTAALTAYNLHMEKLTKGKALTSYTKEQQAEFQRRATDSAELATYKTHGDYSYNNASQLFKAPVLRNIMQFKKIGFVVAELLIDSARTGWEKPRLTRSARELFLDTENSIDIPRELLDKMDGNGWLTEAELEQVRAAVEQYRSRDGHIKELTPEQQDLLEQVMASELHPDNYNTYEQAIINRKSFLYILSTSGLISGSLSVPFLTTLLAFMAKMGGDDDGEELDETSEATIMRVLGPELGSLTLRGVSGGLIGIDVSRRIGINFVEQMLGSVYDVSARDPRSAAGEIAIGMLGPTASLAQDMGVAYSYFSQYQTSGSYHDLMKGFANAAPLGIRNYINASLMDEQGLVNDSRMTLIPRDEFTDGEILRKKVGFSPAKVSEFYQMREHMQAVEQAVNQQRLLIKRSYFEAVRDGDSKRIERVMSQWRQLQEDQRAVSIKPSPLSELREFVQRKRNEERQQIRGLPTTSRNRDLVAKLVQQYGPEIMQGE